MCRRKRKTVKKSATLRLSTEEMKKRLEAEIPKLKRELENLERAKRVNPKTWRFRFDF